MDPIEHAMTVQARVRQAVRVRCASGREVEVPAGALEIDFAGGLAHLRWKDAQGREGAADIHPDEFERYVVAGWILPSVN
jgi:hypothetical protein